MDESKEGSLAQSGRASVSKTEGSQFDPEMARHCVSRNT